MRVNTLTLESARAYARLHSQREDTALYLRVRIHHDDVTWEVVDEPLSEAAGLWEVYDQGKYSSLFVMN
jgi:hypothetical protein